jgi:phage-related protein
MSSPMVFRSSRFRLLGIARVLFTVEGHTMVLLHSFIKKSQKISGTDLQTARLDL